MKMKDMVDILIIDKDKMFVVDTDGVFQDLLSFRDNGSSIFFSWVGDIESDNLLFGGIF